MRRLTTKAHGLVYSIAWLTILVVLFTSGRPASVQAQPSFGMPILKWQLGGCYNSWCETGWYSSPAAADIDNDGQVEVIASAYSIVALNGDSGQTEWRISSGHDRSQPGAPNVGRTWPGIALADVDHDEGLEIVTAHSGGWVSVYNSLGYFEPGWPKQATTRELRGLSVSDLDGNGSMEIIVTGAVNSKVNTWVYEANGTLRPGWPQLGNDSGYAWGVFNANASVGDVNQDGLNEIVVPSDVHYICAYQPNGVQLPANPIYGNKAWGAVGVWESLATELRGWGDCYTQLRAENYRTNFADGPSTLADVNGDGTIEIVATGNVYDCYAGYPPSKYDGVYIFNSDRSRFNDGEFDWQSVPVDTGAPLSEDYNVIESAEPNPAVADIDSDGLREIIYSSYDGRVHAFWLDKTEHGSWPYSVTKLDGLYRFASEPIIADLDSNGRAEVIFTSWTQKNSYQTGKLHILDYLGNPLYEISLPDAFGGEDWNGGLPAPTIANIDSDPDFELVILTAHSGVVAYDLPGTQQAAILWGTGRGNYQRDGNVTNSIQPSLGGSTKASNLFNPNPGDTITFTITLRNPGRSIDNASMADPLPPELAYAGNLWASSGTINYSSGTISWNGTVNTLQEVVIHFDATVDAGIISPTAITNTATISDGAGHSWQRQARIYIHYLPFFLPMIARG